MSDETLKSAPLDELVATTAEGVRELAERLGQRGVLEEDPETAALLTAVRIRLTVAARRLREG
jgi:hypothetical protein